MLVLSQNKLKIVDVNQLILVIKGSPHSQEVEIKELDSPISLATYYSKERAEKVFEDFVNARKRLYKLEHAKDLLSPNEIESIIKNDYLFVFPEEKYQNGVKRD